MSEFLQEIILPMSTIIIMILLMSNTSLGRKERRRLAFGHCHSGTRPAAGSLSGRAG